MKNKIEIKNDVALTIAEGNRYNSKVWKNRQTTLQELFNRLSETRRTGETCNEFKNLSKEKRNEIKDSGGFVGGSLLKKGPRTTSNIAGRQLVTLDLDNKVQPDTWGGFTLLYDNAAVMYSTHSHRAEAPKLRLIFPLDREVLPEEYEPIARRIASYAGINSVDPTCYRLPQFMYWPSTPKDGEYLFEYQDGPLFSADELLATYKDWKDSTEWPAADHEKEIIRSDIKKQGDPLEKPGIIGAFCRAYSVPDAIDTFLPEIYQPCDILDRYSYAKGSTAGGLIIYEDKFAYSHHGTDPISGKLCNAFDLVRLHLFGLQDEDREDQKASNDAMRDFARKDPRVKLLLIEERRESAEADFSEDLEPESETVKNWETSIELGKNDKPLPTINNLTLILENDPKLKGLFVWDELAKNLVFTRPASWHKGQQEKRVSDRDVASLEHYIERLYKISTVKIETALSVISQKHTSHPVRDYLNSQHWDGTPRVETLFIDYLGAADNEFNRAVARKWLAAAVARIFSPGCKFDYMPLLIGDQGQKKSMLADKLGRKWYSDSISTVQGKEAYEQLLGVWIAEMAELAALRKSEVEAVKHFISKREDRFRVSYGRRVEAFPRQCVLIGTTNKRDPLNDPTGGRRFWPVETYATKPKKDIAKDFTDSVIGQIWAEAVQYYRAGELLYMPPHLEATANKMQREATEYDDRAGLIHEYLKIMLPEEWDTLSTEERKQYLAKAHTLNTQEHTVCERTRVSVAEIFCELFGERRTAMNAQNTRFIVNTMNNLPGWKQGTKTTFHNYGPQRFWFTPKDGLANGSYKSYERPKRELVTPVNTEYTLRKIEVDFLEPIE